MANELVTQKFWTVGGGNPHLTVVHLHILCSDDDGDVADTDFSADVMKQIMGWDLYKVQTIVVAASEPTSNTNITLDDANGFDILGGLKVVRVDGAAMGEFTPVMGTTVVKQPIVSQLTFTQDDEQAVNSAEYDLYFYFKKPETMK